MIIECGTAYFSTKFATWHCNNNFALYCNNNFALCLANSGISSFEVVAAGLENLTLLNKLVEHVVG